MVSLSWSGRTTVIQKTLLVHIILIFSRRIVASPHRKNGLVIDTVRRPGYGYEQPQLQGAQFKKRIHRLAHGKSVPHSSVPIAR